MGLEELNADIASTYSEMNGEISIDIGRECRTNLAMLSTALGEDELTAIVERGVQLLFQMTIESGQLDFHLRNNYSTTDDEYLSGMTYEEIAGGTIEFPQQSENDRRYQF